MTLCPIHGKPLTCRACQCAEAGKSKSKRKLAAVSKNLAKANAALNQQKKKEE